MSENRRTLRVREVADMLGVSPLHVHRSIERGELMAVKLGKLVLVTKESLEALIARAGVPANA